MTSDWIPCLVVKVYVGGGGGGGLRCKFSFINFLRMIFVLCFAGQNMNRSTFKGDISRFFIFHCKFLLNVGFNVFIKNPDHFPQCSVIK